VLGVDTDSFEGEALDGKMDIANFTGAGGGFEAVLALAFAVTLAAFFAADSSAAFAAAFRARILRNHCWRKAAAPVSFFLNA
jgi:hypothetical protein